MYRAINLTSLHIEPVRPVVTSCLSSLMSQLSLNSNYTLNSSKQNPSLINHESRRFGRVYRRWHHWPNDFLPFKWERPKQTPPYLNTGDAIRDIGVWDPKSLVPGAEHSKELENAPEIVRRLFSLEFAERRDVVEFQKRRIIEHVQRHPMDFNSPEVRIARLTIQIRNNLHHFTKIDKDDARRKIRQETFKSRRNRQLKDLFYQDRQRYDYIIKLLGITHEVPKLGVIVYKTTRKDEIKRLTTEYCDKIKDERLTEYHKELKSKQDTLKEDFEKIEQLIKEEEKYLGTQNPSPASQS